ncbi:MAG: TetR/AcrR family transcriptional regulator [Chloroflexi bacterium]|nr:TetR/AcrR family transcriptional regulator [Chloroflexota bacterium]
MARIVKQDDYDARRSEILDTAQRLVYTRGYEQMSIQDILDAMQISRGAFYHYFDSKGNLLEALISRMVDEVEPSLVQVVQDPRLSAIQKLDLYFQTAMQWKSGQKTLMMAILRIWYHDDNAIVRQKAFTETLQRIVPHLVAVIEQGVQEGVFHTRHPQQTCQAMMYLFQGLSETVSLRLLSWNPERDDFATIIQLLDAYTDAIERLLGAPAGSVHLFDPRSIQGWFSPAPQPAQSA